MSAYIYDGIGDSGGGGGSSSGFSLKKDTITGAKSIASTDAAKLFYVNTSSSVNITFGTAVGLGNGFTNIYKNVGTSSVSLVAASGESIDGLASKTLAKGDVVLVQSDGSTLSYALLENGSTPKALPILSTVNKAPVSALEQISTGTALPGATSTQQLTLHVNGLYVISVPPSLGTSELYTSTDLITYTKRTAPLDINSKSLVWTGSYFIAFLSGSYSNLSGSDYYRSSDLVSWESAKSLPVSLRVADVVSDGNGTVLIIPYYSTANSMYYKSTDHGVTWTAKAAPISLQDWNYFATYVNGLFLLWGASNYYTCPAGSDTWTTRTLPASNMYAGAITTRSDGKLSLDYQSTYVETPDGIAWTVITKPSAQGTYLKLPSGVVVCASATSPYQLMTSHDNGSTWQQRSGSALGVTGKNYIDFSNLKGLGRGTSLYNLNTTTVGLFSEV